MNFDTLLEKFSSVLSCLTNEGRKSVSDETLTKLRKLAYEFDAADAPEYAGYCYLLAARYNNPSNNLETYLQDSFAAANYFKSADEEFSLTGVDTKLSLVGADIALSSCVPSTSKYPFLKSSIIAQLGQLRLSSDQTNTSVSFEEARNGMANSITSNSWALVTQQLIKCRIKSQEYHEALLVVQGMFEKLKGNPTSYMPLLIWADVTRVLLFFVVFKPNVECVNNDLKKAFASWKSCDSVGHMPRKLLLLLKSLDDSTINTNDRRIICLQLYPLLDDCQKDLLNLIINCVDESLINPLLVPHTKIL